MSEFEVGDEVRIDWDSLSDTYGGDDRYSVSIESLVEVWRKSVPNGIIVDVGEAEYDEGYWVEVENGKDTQSVMTSRVHPFCLSCETDKTYHDKEERWICPFCEIDE